MYIKEANHAITDDFAQIWNEKKMPGIRVVDHVYEGSQPRHYRRLCPDMKTPDQILEKSVPYYVYQA